MIVLFIRIQKVFNQREKKKYKTLRINLCLFFKKTFFAIFSDKICWCLYYGVSRWFWGNDQESKKFIILSSEGKISTIPNCNSRSIKPLK